MILRSNDIMSHQWQCTISLYEFDSTRLNNDKFMPEHYFSYTTHCHTIILITWFK